MIGIGRPQTQTNGLIRTEPRVAFRPAAFSARPPPEKKFEMVARPRNHFCYNSLTVLVLPPGRTIEPIRLPTNVTRFIANSRWHLPLPAIGPVTRRARSATCAIIAPDPLMPTISTHPFQRMRSFGATSSVPAATSNCLLRISTDVARLVAPKETVVFVRPQHETRLSPTDARSYSGSTRGPGSRSPGAALLTPEWQALGYLSAH